MTKDLGSSWAVTDVEREVDCLHYQDSYDDSEHDNSYTTVAIVTVDQDHGDSWTTTSPDQALLMGQYYTNYLMNILGSGGKNIFNFFLC